MRDEVTVDSAQEAQDPHYTPYKVLRYKSVQLSWWFMLVGANTVEEHCDERTALHVVHTIVRQPVEGLDEEENDELDDELG
jgi:hypothetical protein